MPPSVRVVDLPPDNDDIAISAVVGQLVCGGFLEELSPPFKVGSLVTPHSRQLGFNIQGKFVPKEEIGQRRVIGLRYYHILLNTKHAQEVLGWVIRLEGISSPFRAYAFRPA